MKRRPRKVPIAEDRVIGLELFKMADTVSTQILLDTLKSKHFAISPALGRAISLIPDFENFSYSLSRPLIHPTGASSVGNFDMVHQGIHTLIGDRFGVERPGYPLTVLQNECFGQGLEVYYMASLAAAADFKLTEADSIRTFISNDKRLGRRSFHRLFKAAIRDPYAAYKAVTLETFATHLLLLESVVKVRKSKRSAAQATKLLARRIDKSPYLIFYLQFYPLVSTLSVAAKCGLKSNSRDLANVETAMKILMRSSSMPEFLKMMQRG